MTPPVRLVLEFFDQLRADLRGPGGQPVVERAAEGRRAARLPAATLTCPAWFAADAVEMITALLARESHLPIVLAGPDADTLIATAVRRPLGAAHVRDLSAKDGSAVAAALSAVADRPTMFVRPDDGEPAVLRVELHGAAGAGADGPLDGVRGIGLDRRADDLPALEGELDADGIVSQGTPPP